MPAPSLENRSAFKNYIRHFKSKFTSQIQDITLSQFENVLSTRASDVGDVPVKFIVFDNYDTIDVTSLRDNNNYVYLPGLPGDSINFTIDNNNVNLTIVGESSGVEYDDITYTVNQNIDLSDANDTRIAVKGLGGALIQLTTVNSPNYTITSSSATVDENGSVIFTINTNNVPDGTDLYWSLGAVSGSVTTGDFTGATDGTVTINSNTGSVTVSLNPDETTEGVEEFLLALRLNSITGQIVATSSAITINDTSLTPIYTASASPSSIAETETVTITVNTQHVADGTTLAYAVSPANEVDTASGTFAVNNNTGSFTLTAPQDLDVESDETITVTITEAAGGSSVASTTFVITDVAFTATATASTSLIIESATLTVTVNTTGVPDGTVLSVSHTGGATVSTFPLSDVTGGGNITINNNTATSSAITIVRDGRTEGTETFKFEIWNAKNQKIAETSDITIVDSSYTGKNFDNKTFGPISVQRDYGSAAAASDWYSICNIDSIPDGSEIAVFIDGSGSMSQSTVQASLDLLQQKLQPRNITITTVTNSAEDWITPFDTNTI